MKKISLIIGYGGLGSAIAHELHAREHEVIVFYHSPLTSEEASSVNEQRIKVIQCDITSEISVGQAMSKLTEVADRVDNVIFAVTSKLQRKKITQLTLEEYQDDFVVNVFGVFAICRALIPKMIEQKSGTITAITTSAIEPQQKSGAMGGYVSAKYALRGLLRQLTEELTPHHIRVNAVAPGFVRTPLQSDMPERLDGFIKEKNPAHSMTTSDDVAKVVAFLVSDEARSLYGLSIPINYGETMTL